jgi:hypothetical protein
MADCANIWHPKVGMPGFGAGYPEAKVSGWLALRQCIFLHLTLLDK